MGSKLRKAKQEVLANSLSRYSNKLTLVPPDEYPKEFEGLLPSAVWCSRQFLVQCFNEPNGIIRLSVTKNKLGMGRTFDDGIDWVDLQAIKSAVGYDDKMAIEIFPAEDRVVNACNMRHLWVLPEPLKIGWNQR